MGRKYMVDSKFWTDPWIVDHLDPLSSYVYMYLFTNSHANVSGIYEISLRTIAYETKIEKDEIERMMKRFEPHARYVDGWVVVRAAVSNQNYHSPKMKVAIDNVLKTVPAELIQYIKWPDDYGTEKPKGSNQTSLLEHESDTNLRISTHSQPDDVLTTETGVAYGIDTVSHSNSNSNYNNNNNRRPIGLQAKAVDDGPSKPKTRSKDIDDMLDYWQERVGYKIESGMRKNRFAISNLLKKHGPSKLKRLIDGVALAKQDRYAPSINDFSQLQFRFNDFIAWGHKRQMIANDNESTVIS